MLSYRNSMKIEGNNSLLAKNRVYSYITNYFRACMIEHFILVLIKNKQGENHGKI